MAGKTGGEDGRLLVPDKHRAIGGFLPKRLPGHRKRERTSVLPIRNIHSGYFMIMRRTQYVIHCIGE